MKFKLYQILLISFTFAQPNAGSAQSFPNCNSASSDTDNDGYGWENNTSCIVVNGQPPLDNEQCEDRGGYPWGWNSLTLSSCRLDQTTPIDPVEPTEITFEQAIRAELIGSWECDFRFLVPDRVSDPLPADLDTGCGLDPSRRGQGSSDCNVSWGSTTYITDLGNGVIGLPGQSWIDFNQNGTGQRTGVQQGPDGSTSATGWGDIGWSFTGYQLTINGTVAHRVSFEEWQGQRYFSFNIDDENRTTCKRR